MASSESSSSASWSYVPIRGWTYEVFLSFRGEDIRNSFMDHLYGSLHQRGICVFKDDNMLRRGERISLGLTKAIEQSRFLVVVFSKNYANSSWCLDELVKIMECEGQRGQKVLPVFYHVDPSHVRHQKGNFAAAFQKHEEKYKEEMINKWRKALTAAANLSGWHIPETGHGGEYAFVSMIVKEIFGDLPPQGVEKNLIGIESRIEKLLSLLDAETVEEVRMVGILGMGGIGKTTIARALFNKITHKFEGSCFVGGVRERSSNRRDLCGLQKEILKDILRMDDAYMIKDPEDGAEMMRTRLCNKKVVLVLDDVNNVEQLQFLAATHEWFGAGSRIIITTRDEHLLWATNAKYKPPLLTEEQAIKLFSRHAFRKNSPPQGYEELSNRAICNTGYLPLALKVLGSFFHGRDASVWESALNRLVETPNHEITKTLKLSFDGLDVFEKKIFLDIVCFFKGFELEHATRVLDSFGYHPMIGINVLVEKSLITISKKRLYVHDLIQEMGLQIVRENFAMTRLWNLEEVQEVIKKNKGLEETEAIWLPFSEKDKLAFSGNVFKSMKNLRLLNVNGKFTSSIPTVFPDELLWLRWRRYPYSSLPVPQNLVGLNIIDGNIKQLWNKPMILRNLRFIQLRDLEILKRFPDVSGAPNVERLTLLGCVNLVEVHKSLGFLKRLVYLEIRRCHKLKFLPSMIEMESLETLDISHCDSLRTFPEVSPCMINLSKVNLVHCFELKKLPSSIRHLSSLSVLNLTNCQSFESVPNSFCELKNLKTLNLDGCFKLQNLPEEFGSMEKLEVLHLGSTYNMTSLRLPNSINFSTFTNLCSLRVLHLRCRAINNDDFPENLHAFSSLEELDLSGNNELIQLPASIFHVSRLKHLELYECNKLINLQGLPLQIQSVNAIGCSRLEKIDDFSREYDWLFKIWLEGCVKLSAMCLSKMVHQSFLKKCARVDHRLSILVPGSKVPSWFKEQRDGCKVGLKLAPKWQTHIMGFAVCGVFLKGWLAGLDSPEITFTIDNDGKFIYEPLINDFNVSEAAYYWSVWICYIPLSYFEQMCEFSELKDWYDIECNIAITVRMGREVGAVRCGAHVIYKRDVESAQQNKTCISDYCNIVNCEAPDSSFTYKEKICSPNFNMDLSNM